MKKLSYFHKTKPAMQLPARPASTKTGKDRFEKSTARFTSISCTWAKGFARALSSTGPRKTSSMCESSSIKSCYRSNPDSFDFPRFFRPARKRIISPKRSACCLEAAGCPYQVNFAEYAKQWYELLKSSGRVSKRTLWGYNSYIENYLAPYFEELTFSDLNKAAFDRFVLWAKNRCLRGQPIGNETINKIFVPLKMICKDAAISYGWQSNFNPFFGLSGCRRAILTKTFNPSPSLNRPGSSRHCLCTGNRTLCSPSALVFGRVNRSLCSRMTSTGPAIFLRFEGLLREMITAR